MPYFLKFSSVVFVYFCSWHWTTKIKGAKINAHVQIWNTWKLLPLVTAKIKLAKYFVNTEVEFNHKNLAS